MKAFLVKRTDGSFLDTVIRANDVSDAKSLLADDERNYRIGEIKADVASSMGAPKDRGKHDGALGRWIVGPADWSGDVRSG
jgi:hypothetical protein